MKYLKSLYSILFLFIFLNPTFSQNLYHRAKIDLKDKNPFLLLKAGIALDHGKLAIGRYFESDFSVEEINAIKKLGFDIDVIIEDVESYYSNSNRPSELEEGLSGLRDNNCNKKGFDYKTPFNYFEGSMGGYFTYDEMIIILEWMHTLYPAIISKIDTIDGYTTHQGNKILYIKVSDNVAVNEAEPEVLYTALHHAREPNSLSQMIFYLWYLLENYNSNAEIKYLVDNTQMYFVPCVNPDGYNINYVNKPNGGGLWRKNGKTDNNGKLIGVDLNRNYGFNWGFDDEGSSPASNSETYRGSSAFSEPETSAIREFCSQHQFIISLNYHTFGNLLVHPWGYSDLPTEEDVLFKNLGRTMNFENNFRMGTGTETVGYTTNGDADDYMYGEQAEKIKMYSFTPEVGPSFWPPKQDIDYLNKSALQMNLGPPRLVNGYITHTKIDRVFKHIDTLELTFLKPSFKNMQVDVEMEIDRIFGESNRTSAALNLLQGEKQIIRLPFELDKNSMVVGKNDIKVYLTKNYGSYLDRDSFYINVFNGDQEKIFTDDCSTMNNWTADNGNWGVTNLFFTSSPYSITDSPFSNYIRGGTTTLQLFQGIDLIEANSPLLSFNAKWNIEENYDYVSIYAFTPQGDTIRLCGEYTNIGTKDQKSGIPVYDGESDWVNEIISLEAFKGMKDVFINIELVADAFLEKDGFYIDDVEILSYQPSVTKDDFGALDQKNQLIFPNPASSLIRFNNPTKMFIELRDLNGKIFEKTQLNPYGQIDLTYLSNGVYNIVTSEKEGITIRHKLIIVK